MPSMAPASDMAMSTDTIGAVESKMSMMPPMEMITYRYVYTGELDIPTGILSVYAKNTLAFNSTELGKFLGGMNFEGFDIRALENTEISSLTLLENREFGYIVSADFAGGTLSLYQNYEKWPQVKCTPSGCEEQKQLTESDIPSDEEILSASDGFLTKYGIDMSLYGTPRVDHQMMNVMPIE